jgi:hypothetical protein
VAGGYFDQPHTLMLDLAAVRRARDEVSGRQANAALESSGDQGNVYSNLAAQAMALAAKGG